MLRYVCMILVCLAGALAPWVPAHAAPPQPGSYYLALGDSLAEGVTATGVPTDPQCQSSTAPGYVCVFYRYLQQINPSIGLDNLGKADVDSCVMVHGFGNGSPCTDPLMAHPYPSELDAAVQYLKAHSGQVSPITVNIGGDDLAGLLKQYAGNPSLGESKLPSTLADYRSNLDTILSTLRTTAPNAEIILTTQYNPAGGIPSFLLPAGFSGLEKDALDNGINQIMRDEAPKYSVIVADVASAFDAHSGGATSLTYVPATLTSGDPNKINIHPTPQGYQVFAQTIITASGYTIPVAKPLSISARLSAGKVTAGTHQTVRGTTMAGATVKISVHLPKRSARSLTVSANATGEFSKTFSVGKSSGKAWAMACASDSAGHSSCSQKLTFQVTKKRRIAS